MIWTQHVSRTHVAVVAVLAVTASALVLLPAVAQQAGAATPTPYVEFLVNDSSSTRYVKLVDGDAATSDPQEDFTALAPLALSGDPDLVSISAAANPQAVLAGTPCLDATSQPIGALPPATPTQYLRSAFGLVATLPLVGVRSYACAQDPTPRIVADDGSATITPGETLNIGRGADLPLDFRRLKLSIQAASTSEVRVTAKRNGSVVGTIDVDIDVDCIGSNDWENADSLCATRLVPFVGALRMRYLNLDFGGPFDSFEVTSPVGNVRLRGDYPSKFYLDGEVFGGTIGGETGASAVSEPPTETLPGYETLCSDASDPPPEGPCGGKEVNLSISRFLSDVDGDGQVDQVLDVVPSGAVADLAFLTLTVKWAPEDVPVGPVPLSGVDEDGAGPDDDDPAAWCSVDPPGAPGDQWCLATSTAASAGLGQIQVTETYYGTGDPRLTR